MRLAAIDIGTNSIHMVIAEATSRSYHASSRGAPSVPGHEEKSDTPRSCARTSGSLDTGNARRAARRESPNAALSARQAAAT